MFSELNNLDYETLIKVCNAIFAEWDSYSGISHRLPDNISAIVYSFLNKYSCYEYKELLVKYVKERTFNESSRDVRNSGQSFLKSIMLDF